MAKLHVILFIRDRSKIKVFEILKFTTKHFFSVLFISTLQFTYQKTSVLLFFVEVNWQKIVGSLHWTYAIQVAYFYVVDMFLDVKFW